MNPSQASRLRRETQMILAHNILDRSGPAYRGIRTLLFRAQHDLRMKMGLLSVAIPGGQPFDYFDEIRKITEMARDDLLFVDPYMDADFVSQYLPQIKSEVTATYIEETHVPATCSSTPCRAKRAAQNIDGFPNIGFNWDRLFRKLTVLDLFNCVDILVVPPKLVDCEVSADSGAGRLEVKRVYLATKQISDVQPERVPFHLCLHVVSQF